MLNITNISEDTITVILFDGKISVELAPGQSTVTPADAGVRFIIDGQELGRFDHRLGDAIEAESYTDLMRCFRTVVREWVREFPLPVKEDWVMDRVRRMERQVLEFAINAEESNFFLDHRTRPLGHHSVLELREELENLSNILEEDAVRQIKRLFNDAHRVLLDIVEEEILDDEKVAV